MKKKIGLMLALMCLAILCLVTLSSCGNKRLSAPSNFRVDGDTLTLTWSKVKEATAYYIEVDDTVKTSTRQNSYPLTSLSAGEHTIRIQAITNNDEFENSVYAEYIFEKVPETGLIYTLINNKTEYELTGLGTADGDVVMESVFRGKPVTSIAKSAFRRNGRLTKIVIGEHVKSIGEYAFAACSGLTEIVLPESLESISPYAFQNCPKLESIVIPKKVTSIPEYAFSLCRGLVNVSFDGSITSIGNYAFTNCESLTNISLPDSIQTIGDYAFSGCSKLPEIKLGSNVNSLGEYAFYNCTELKNVTFGTPDGGCKLTSIGVAAFSETAISLLIVPDSVKIIDISAFRNCASLQTIKLGSGIEKIGTEAFWGTKFYNDAPDTVVADGWIIECKNKDIKSFEFDSSIVGIADSAFNACTKLESINSSTVKYVGEYAFANCMSLWEVILDGPIIDLGAYSFANCEVLRDVVLGSDLKTIGDYSFYLCKTLEDSGINLPDTLTRVGVRAFLYTRLYNNADNIVYVDNWVVGIQPEAVMDVVLKDGIKGIADYAFYDGMLLNSFHIADTVESIGKGAFYKQGYLSYINLPANLKLLGDFSFADCYYLQFGDLGKVKIPEGTEKIGKYAFQNCTLISSLHIPGTVKSIGDGAFKGCTNLGEGKLGYEDEDGNWIPVYGDLVLGEGIESIGSSAFYGCQGIVKLDIPDSVTFLGSAAFYNCEKIKTLEIGSGLKHIADYTFYNCSSVEAIVIPTNVKSIGKYAFRGCSTAKDLTISEGVESIGNFAFYKCENVKKLVLPASLTTIGDYSFRNMSKLTAVMIGSNLVNVGKHSFYGNSATIYTEFESVPSTWSERWNSSYRPVVWGVTLSEDNGYVVSFVKNANSIENISELKPSSAPSRKGYTFDGWSTEANGKSVYAADNFISAPDGTTLYSLWSEGEPVDPEVPEDTETDGTSQDSSQDGTGGNASGDTQSTN
ncbi:MAG: leucine-rich repeat protein [Clostridia bacterium]|nr:leucine-rich repeat protein [Clostridia bacterium]